MTAWRLALVGVLALGLGLAGAATAGGKGKPMVLLSTSMGDIKVELSPDKAPVTVKNFLDYVKAGYYDGTIFHRVISGFMIQGGGLTADMQEKREGQKPPIKNESDNGLKNDTGTVAMARTNVPNSATSQFFINVKDNEFLNGEKDKPGYAAGAAAIRSRRSPVPGRVVRVAARARPRRRRGVQSGTSRPRSRDAGWRASAPNRRRPRARAGRLPQRGSAPRT